MGNSLVVFSYDANPGATFADYLDSNGVRGPPVKIQVTLEVAGDTLTADFTGSDPQVPGAINATKSFTESVVALCVRSVLREEVPNTAGLFRPLRVIAPPGTIVNGVMPAASSMRGVTGFRMVDAVFGALAGLLPERVLAAGEGGNTLVILGGRRPDASPYVYYELLCGTWGGRPDRDGNDGLCNPANVASNIPVEDAECEYPIRIERYDIEALVGLLREDVVLSMPPWDVWLQGPQELADWFLGQGIVCEHGRLLPINVNGTTGFGNYHLVRPGLWEPWAIQVIEVAGGKIVGHHNFLYPELFAEFGLPDRIEA